MHEAHAFIKRVGPMSDSREFAAVRDMLPSVPAAQVEVLNSFYRRRGPLAVRALGRRLEIAAVVAAPRPPLCRLEIEFGGERGALLVPRRLIDLVFQEVDRSLDFERLNPAQAAILIEFALQDALKAIEAAVGEKIAVLSAGRAPERPEEAAEPGLTFKLSIPEAGEAQLHLHLPPAALAKFSRYLNANAARPALDPKAFEALSFPACMRVGAMVFSQAELASLNAGDVIMLDGKAGTPAAALVIGETIAAPLAVEGGRAMLTDDLRIAARSPLAGMTADAVAHGASADAKGLFFVLTFELSRFQASLGDIRGYRRGTILPVGSQGGSVDIAVNGTAIGLGEWVHVGSGTGIMVTRLFQPSGLGRGHAEQRRNGG